MFTQGDKSLTKENILKRIDSYQLFRTYCKNFKEVNKKFSSEFRKDKEPSCVIIFWDGDLLYKDFGERSYRVFDYIGRKFNLNYNQVLQKVNADFGLGLGYSSNQSVCTSLVIPEKTPDDSEIIDFAKKTTVIDIQPRNWTKQDKAYWDSYKIPLKLLNYHNIKSISHYKLIRNETDTSFYRVNPFMLAYSIDYYWNNGIFRRKLYFPQSKTRRFIANIDATIVQGWTLLPKNGGEILFITKSYKDILIFNLLGYWAIAPNNEGAYIPSHVMDKLKTRWHYIYVWFDNDEGGIRGASSFSEKFGLSMTYNPIGEPKDPSDYVKKYSLTKFDDLITSFLRNVT